MYEYGKNFRICNVLKVARLLTTIADQCQKTNNFQHEPECINQRMHNYFMKVILLIAAFDGWTDFLGPARILHLHFVFSFLLSLFIVCAVYMRRKSIVDEFVTYVCVDIGYARF